MLTGWLWLDPVLSLLIVIVILIGTWNLLKESVNLSVDAVPEGTDIQGIKNYLTKIDNVTAFHDLHVWALSTTETALTVHLVTSDEMINNAFLLDIQQQLHDKFHIEHVTIQIENISSENSCVLNRPECI